MAPTIFDEVGGVYLGFDNKVHKLDNNQTHYYTDMSIWDVHRTEYPFLGLIAPNILNDIVKSLLLMYQQGGDLPRWPLANGNSFILSLRSEEGIVVHHLSLQNKKKLKCECCQDTLNVWKEHTPLLLLWMLT
jgi:putative alpha-1,2-mannosidase